MAFGEFYQAFSGLGDAFLDARNQAEARKLLERQLDTAVSAQALPTQPTAAPALGPLGSVAPQTPRLPSFAATDGAMGDYLATTRAKESGGNDLAKNPTSTATGRYQFTGGTWAGLARKYPELGLTSAGRTDPAQQERAMQAFTRDNANALTAAGVPITPGNLYVSHFLGEAGGPRFIRGALSNPDAPATAFVTPQAAAANRTIFFNRDGTPKRAGDVYAERTSRYGNGSVEVPTRVAATTGPTMALPGSEQPVGPARTMPMQVASTDSGAADMPAPSALPVQGFVVPGQGAPAAQPDFTPGTVASPALAQPSAGAGVSALSPAAAQRLSPAQVENLRAMLRNPVTQGHAAKIIEGLNRPAEYSFQVVGDQLIRTSKDGRAEAVPNITKPPTFQTVKGQDGNDYTFNPQTGQWVRAIAGKDTARRDLSAAEKQARGIDPNAFAQVDGDGQVYFPGKAATEIKIGDSADKAAAVKAAGTLIDRFDAVAKEGDAARSDVALIGELKALGGAIGTGGMAALQGKLGEYGIKLGENAGRIEAYNALVDRLTPAQRLPGAGATSDFDARMFKGSLPRLMNTPEGNALIADTLEAVARDRIARGEIADQGLLRPEQGGLPPQEVLRQLKALPSVQTAFVARMKQLREAGKLSATPQPEPQGGGQGMPQAGQPRQAPASVLNEARDAIRRGAPREAVAAEMRRQGLDPSGL